ncbi:hypothetical protein WP50_19670 [Lactiplantibacillus plantarum]|nr:hypothetical protein WP50_19670 [Lactiplantibacillus plantarum]
MWWLLLVLNTRQLNRNRVKPFNRKSTFLLCTGIPHFIVESNAATLILNIVTCQISRQWLNNMSCKEFHGNIPVIPNMYFIYGDGGTGKTSVVKQFVGHKLLFSFDMSSNVLIGDKNVDVIIFEHRDMPNIQAMVEQNGQQFEIITNGIQVLK